MIMHYGAEAYLDFLHETHSKVCSSITDHFPEPVFLPQISPGPRSFIGSLLFRNVQKTCAVILPDRDRAEEALEEYAFYLGIKKLDDFDNELVYLPEADYFSLLEKGKTPAENDEFLFFYEKIQKKVRDNKPFIAIIQGTAFGQKFPLTNKRDLLPLRIYPGKIIDYTAFQHQLVRLGYRRVKTVYEPGEFCVKGSLLDIFPYYREYPVRISLWDESIENISGFDIHSQVTRPDDKQVEGIELIPKFDQKFFLKDADSFIRLDQILPSDTVYVVEEYDALLQNISDLHDNIYELEKKTRGESEISLRDLYISHKDMSKKLFNKGTVFLGGFYPDKEKTVLAERKLQVKEKLPWKKTPEEIHEYKGLQQYLEKHIPKQSVLIVCNHVSQSLRLARILREDGFGAICLDKPQPYHRPIIVQKRFEGEIALVTGYLHHGFYCSQTKTLVISDREIFGRYQKERMFKITPQKGRMVRDFSELNPGDYVVHLEYGIGIFHGLVQETIDNSVQEFIKLEYAEGDEVYVPVMELNKLQKYIPPSDDYEPSLTKLGTGQWERQKKRILEDVGKTARYLVQLQAERMATRGYAFGADDHDQREFEGAFIYDETPDQLKAVEEVKKDMESSFPMERLLCGDVGFGKTEVAMRAAFKCCRDGKQVAVLAPTTVLAHQHYYTFSERFRYFPVEINLLSGLQTSVQQKKVVKKIADHEYDIIIGTHRLLSHDVRFADLGLLIIDEEQRFGVRQKEKLKELKTNVDILYLSATPIPRTLYMALQNLKDISLIQTPPINRLPIISRVYYWNEEIVKSAVLQETHRGGQVYYLYNRVEMIGNRVEYLRKLLPGIKIEFLHAKMPKQKIQDIMLRFIRGDFQVLVATTIIENGLDIPNVNTLIIEGAEKFGLAQLYQIRGRIGRRHTQAFAYFFIMTGSPTKRARQRLEVIRQIDHLGSGLEIAQKDMQIRGAGSLIGKKQHGNLLQIGVETYAELLRQEVKKIQHKRPELDLDVSITWTKPSFIPHSYVEDDVERYSLYKRLSQVENIHQLRRLNAELKDRYGPPTREVQNLLFLSQLKYTCKKALITSLHYDLYSLTLGFFKEISPELIQSLEKSCSQYFKSIKVWNMKKICIKLNALPMQEILRIVQFFKAEKQ